MSVLGITEAYRNVSGIRFGFQDLGVSLSHRVGFSVSGLGSRRTRRVRPVLVLKNAQA